MGTPPIQVKLFKDNILLASDIGTVYSRWTETATYSCFANNSLGTDSRDFQVTLLDCDTPCSYSSYWEDFNYCDCSNKNKAADFEFLKCIPTTTSNLNLGYNEMQQVPTGLVSNLPLLSIL
ncbi:hypothetical protein ABFA07_021901 [Porites harrisoni]